MAEIRELTHFAGCGSRYGAKDTASKEILGLPGNPQNTYQNKAPRRNLAGVPAGAAVPFARATLPPFRDRSLGGLAKKPEALTSGQNTEH